MSAPKKNGFILFAEKRKKELEREGHVFTGGLKEVIELVSEQWNALPETEKLRYKIKAKNIREGITPPPVPPRLNISKKKDEVPEPPKHACLADDELEYTGKKTPFGFSTYEITNVSKEKRAQAHRFRRDIVELLDTDVADPRNHEFIILNCSIYCVTENREYIPAEIGLCVFSLNGGVTDQFASLIDPGLPPVGKRWEFTEVCNRNGLPLPPFNRDCRDYKRILDEFNQFVKMHPTKGQELPMLFCLRDEMYKVEGCLTWLYKAAGLNESPYQMRSLSYLLFQMTRIGSRKYDIEEQIRKTMVFQDDWIKLLPKKQMKKNVPWVEYGENIMHARNLPDYSGQDIKDNEKKVEPNRTGTEEATASTSDSLRVEEAAKKSGERPVEGWVKQVITSFAELGKIGYPKSEAKDKFYDESKQIFLFERDAAKYLEALDFAFAYELGCQHHNRNIQGIETCPLNIVNRYAFNLLDLMMGFWNITPIAGLHYPILQTREENEKRRAMMLAMFRKSGYERMPKFKDSTLENKVNYVIEDEERAQLAINFQYVPTKYKVDPMPCTSNPYTRFF